MSKKPTFIVVPGAWHGPETFHKTTKELEAAGYKVSGVTLACWGAEPPVQDLEPDRKAVRAAIDAALADGEDVVVVMHSYGGVAGGEGLKGVDPARVRRIVYLSAFVFPEAVNVNAALGGQDPPWFRVEGDKVFSSNEAHVFYNDMPAAEAAEVTAGLRHHSYRCFFVDQSHAPWRTIPSTYILCAQDNAIPLEAQKGMVDGAQKAVPSAFDVVELMDTSHSPFLSQPAALAKLLIKAAGGA